MSEITYRGSRDSVTVYVDGNAHTVKAGTANYKPLMEALSERRWDDVPGLLTVHGTVEAWAQGEFTVANNQIVFRGEPVQDPISKRILAMITGGEDPAPLLRFYERLERNPSWRSVTGLYGFLAHEGIPIEPNGTFLAYKSVRDDCKDHHTGKVDYSPSREGDPNRVVKVPRNRVSDDPHTACHYGLHVGALGYARGFGSGGKIIICRIDPEHVVCVPYDSSQQKMRVCELEVVGFWNGRPMPSTSVRLDDYEDDDGFDEDEDDYDDDGLEPEEVEDGPDEDDEDDEDDLPSPQPVVTTAKPRGNFVADAALKAKWRRWDKKDEVGLEEQALDDLRKYATYHVKLVGASKIPGGKPALVRSIIEVRDGSGHK